jgi:hypothetical protein
MVRGNSRSRLARASFDALFRSAGSRDRAPGESAAASYQDVVRVLCRPTPGQDYNPPIAIQADGEVLGAACAEIEMAGVDVLLLSD